MLPEALERCKDIYETVEYFFRKDTDDAMQGQRFWIERAFEDAKGSLGMADYQLRKFRGWKHHMALTLLAHLFLLRERISNAQEFPLLSCQDVVTMLEFYLPKRDVTEEELFRQMAERHRKRQDGIDRGKVCL